MLHRWEAKPVLAKVKIVNIFLTMGPHNYEKYFTWCLFVSMLSRNLCNSLTVSSSTNRAILSVNAPRSSSALRDALIGRYVNQNYDVGNGRTDDHYVEISYLSTTTLAWTSRSGKSWTLSLRPDGEGYEPGLLNAVEDGSYSTNGSPSYWFVSWNSEGTSIVSVMGPAREYFDRVRTSEEVINLVVGTYECIEYDEKDKNNWHFVTITKESDTRLRWTNDAGVSWNLHLIEYESGFDSTKLKVDEACPYYKRYKHREAALDMDTKSNSLQYIRGPFNERYEKIYTTEEIRDALAGSYYNYDPNAQSNAKILKLSKHPCTERGLYWTLNSAEHKFMFLNKAMLGFDRRLIPVLSPWDVSYSGPDFEAFLVWNPYIKKVVAVSTPNYGAFTNGLP